MAPSPGISGHISNCPSKVFCTSAPVESIPINGIVRVNVSVSSYSYNSGSGLPFDSMKIPLSLPQSSCNQTQSLAKYSENACVALCS